MRCWTPLSGSVLFWSRQSFCWSLAWELGRYVCLTYRRALLMPSWKKLQIWGWGPDLPLSLAGTCMAKEGTDSHYLVAPQWGLRSSPRAHPWHWGQVLEDQLYLPPPRGPLQCQWCWVGSGHSRMAGQRVEVKRCWQPCSMQPRRWCRQVDVGLGFLLVPPEGQGLCSMERWLSSLCSSHRPGAGEGSARLWMRVGHCGAPCLCQVGRESTSRWDLLKLQRVGQFPSGVWMDWGGGYCQEGAFLLGHLFCSFSFPLSPVSLLGSVGGALLPKASLSLGARVGVEGAFLVGIRWLFPLGGFRRLSCVGGSKETRGHTEVSFPVSRGPSSHLSEPSCVYCNVQGLGSQGRGPGWIGTTPRGGTRVWSLTP